MALSTSFRKLSLVYVVLVLSLGYIVFLAFSIHQGIYFAGDQALKSLEVKQIAAGYGFKYLHLPQPQWVREVWQAGYFPLKPPFFYPSPNGYIIVYPPMFQIISSFFYSALGVPGLYILPILCTLVLLGWLTLLLWRTGASPLNIMLSLFILVFCSPLTVYGVMFWEHLPAVLLLFAGVAFIAHTPSRLSTAITLGLITGQAIWLRPEALVMNFLYCAAIGVLFLRERRPVYVAFIASVAVSVLPWMLFNQVEYGSVFGMHGMQVLYDHDADTRIGWKNGWRNLVNINKLSVRYFWFVLFLIPVLFRLVRRRELSDLRPLLLSGIVILFSLLAPFILPNDGVIQWGPRYFLAIIPATVVALSLAATQWDLFRRWNVPLWLTVVMFIASVNAFYLNTHGGGYKELRYRYNERLADSYRLIDSKPGNVVVVLHQWMTYDFGYLFDRAYFFAESGNDSLRRLIPLLKSHGVHQFIYVFDPRVPTLPTMLKDSTTQHWWDDKVNNVYVQGDIASKVYTIN